MDIVTRLAHTYWDFLWDMDVVLQMLLVRWFLILLGMTLFGLPVRYVLSLHTQRTVTFQALAAILGLAFGLSVPIGKLIFMPRLQRNVLMTVAILGWIGLPRVVPYVLIRRRGFQELCWRLLYAFEFGLLLIQLLLL